MLKEHILQHSSTKELHTQVVAFIVLPNGAKVAIVNQNKISFAEVWPGLDKAPKINLGFRIQAESFLQGIAAQ